MSPTRYRVWDGAALLATGGPALIGPVPVDNTLTRAQRAALTPATYVPDKKTNGLLPGWTPRMLTPVYPSGSATYVTLTAGQTYQDKIFWCEVRMPRGVTTGPDLSNCIVAGQDPRTIGSSGAAASQCIKASDSDVGHWTMRDSIVSQAFWTDASLDPPGGAMDLASFRFLARNSVGISGGFMTLDSVEITGVQDGVQYKQPNSSAYSQLTKVWIHGLLYYRGAGHSQTEGTHSDGLQIMLGGHLTVTGGLLGGFYDPVGYAADPGYNSGDDAANAELMWTQETWNVAGVYDASRVVDYLEFDRVMFRGVGRNATTGGPSYNVNVNLNDTYPSMYPNSSMHDCLFEDRSATGNKEIIRDASLGVTYTNNRRFTLDDSGTIVVGALIPYTNG